MRVPLTPRTIRRMPCPRPELDVGVLAWGGDFVAIRFVVDVGADVSQISVALAEEFKIPFERIEDRRMEIHTPGGIGFGWLNYFTVSLCGLEPVWPCCFTELPAGAKRALPPLLGRLGLLDDFDIRIEGGFFDVKPRRRKNS